MIPFLDAQMVNALVNARPYRADIELYGRPEFWEALGKAGGDCEDFALAKRAELLKRGAAHADLRLALCWTEAREFHAVLVASTDRGEFVLDNRHHDPMAREALGYAWHSIQQGATWHALA